MPTGHQRREAAHPLRTNHLLLLISFATVVVIGVIASLALNTWVLLPVALAAHAAGSFAVTAFALRLTNSAEKPDPVTAARLEAEGTSPSRTG